MIHSRLTDEKKIFYENEIEFKIIPKIRIPDILDFKEFMIILQSSYGLSNNDNCFFWDFDEKKNSIIVNNKTTIVENDIFNQITMMAIWLFEKNYCMEGSFYSRTENIIEYISMDGVSKFINHYILYDYTNSLDTIKARYFEARNSEALSITSVSMGHELGNGEIIMIDAKNKIKQLIKKNNSLLNISSSQCNLPFKEQGSEEPKPYNRERYSSIGGQGNSNPITINKIYHKYFVTNKEKNKKNVTCVMVNSMDNHEEDKMVINLMQERLTNVENKLKSLTKINKFFWKICTVVSLFTAGTFLMYITFVKENNVTINNCSMV